MLSNSEPDLFEAVILLDPVIRPPEGCESARDTIASGDPSLMYKPFLSFLQMEISQRTSLWRLVLLFERTLGLLGKFNSDFSQQSFQPTAEIPV